MGKLDTEKFIENARRIHGNKYSYDKVIYINSHTPVVVTCPIHGDFLVTPNAHISSLRGCPECTGKRLNTERFIERANKIHNNKYDYSKTVYTGYTSDVIITCPIHGDFSQIASYHLSGNGCPSCARERNRLTADEFIKRAKEVHGNKYNYDKVIYINSYTPVIITCPIHGDFSQQPSHHIHLRQGCPECSHDSKRLTTDEFVKKAREIHGDKYNYDKVIYINNYTKVVITCPIHGDFLMTPTNHIKDRCGCPKCNSPKLEEQVRVYLTNKNISFIEQMRWEWLKYKKPQSVDFFLPELNIAIECQGLQHFQEVDLFDKRQSFEERLLLDENKQRLCLLNGIKIYYLSNVYRKNFQFPYLVFENIEDLMNEAIKSKGLIIL